MCEGRALDGSAYGASLGLATRQVTLQEPQQKAVIIRSIRIRQATWPNEKSWEVVVFSELRRSGKPRRRLSELLVCNSETAAKSFCTQLDEA